MRRRPGRLTPRVLRWPAHEPPEGNLAWRAARRGFQKGWKFNPKPPMIGLTTGVSHPRLDPRQMASWQAAQQKLVAGQCREVVGVYQSLAARYPETAQLWFELGLAAAGAGEFGVAEPALTRAGRLAASDPVLLALVGQQFARLRRPGPARDCFQRAVAAAPGSPHALLSLAAWWEREGCLDEAAACVERCLAAHPGHLPARCFQALVLHRQGDSSAAAEVLGGVVRTPAADSGVRQTSRHLLGIVLDALGQPEEALRWIGEAKTILRQAANLKGWQHDYQAADHRRRDLVAGLTTADLTGWQRGARAGTPPFRVALLGGHPRSGTTLLERVIAVSPGVAAVDESEAFAAEIWNALAPLNGRRKLSLARLRQLSPAAISRHAEQYRRRMEWDSGGPLAGRLCLDKNPSLTGALHLWLRHFPDSKVVIALRDPRDVVISCYFQNLDLTPSNANFLSLEGTVRHYTDLMDTWLRFRECGGFDWIETRYEDLVADPAAEGARVCRFLGLDGQGGGGGGAAGSLVSPSYSDAPKPIHTRSVARWRAYAAALAPWQAALAPYCRAFGYHD